MKRLSRNLWSYQRVLLICIAIMFSIYAMILNISMSIVVLYLMFIIPGIIAPNRVCRSVPMFFTHHILFNYCGSLLPLCAAVLILIHGNISWYHIVVLTSMSIALTSLHTYITDKLILVNVARYFASFITLSLAILDIGKLLHIIPFAITVGVIVGSDLIPYIVTSLIDKDRKTISIGGFMALDAISISLILALATLVVLVFFFN